MGGGVSRIHWYELLPQLLFVSVRAANTESHPSTEFFFPISKEKVLLTPITKQD